MQFNPTELSWLLEVQFPRFLDDRGSFTRVFTSSIFEDTLWYLPIFRETFYSVSVRGVIRGMHFQVPPCVQDKLVYVIGWIINDVVLDIRTESPTFWQYIVRELSFENKKALFIPKGFAHGFLSKSEQAVVAYMVTESWDPDCDKGIHYDSFGYDWNIEHPIVSTRDLNQTLFSNFISPF